MMLHLCALKKVGWAVVVLGAERLRTGGGGGYVSKSVRPTLCSGYFLNQTSLLPCAYLSRASAFVPFPFGELHPSGRAWLSFWCIFKESRRNTQFLKQTEPESLRVVARRAFP